MKHTPEPWKVEKIGSLASDGLTFVTSDLGGICELQICTMQNRQKRGECEANARLISAAPDLLEALKDALKYIEDEDGKTIDRFEKIIAKAEGKEGK